MARVKGRRRTARVILEDGMMREVDGGVVVCVEYPTDVRQGQVSEVRLYNRC